jgi:hypothetical protein
LEIPPHHNALPGGIKGDPKKYLAFCVTDYLPVQHPDTGKNQVVQDIPQNDVKKDYRNLAEFFSFLLDTGN